MKAKVVLFSKTGNTRGIGKDLKKRLERAGHDVTLEEVTADGDPQKMGENIKFKNRPGVDEYDTILFGSPVWGFSLPPIMKQYLEGIGSLKGKKIGVFSTKKLSFHWTGGNRTNSQMEKICRSKGGEVLDKAVIVCKKSGPEKDADDILDRFVSSFR